MEKRVLALLLISVLFMSFFIVIMNSVIVSAQEDIFTQVGKSLEGFYKVWTGETTDTGALGLFTKWLALFLLVVLVYAALTFVKFPESGFLRILIAVIVGFLATVFITTPELLTMIQSYKSLGVAIIIFFPILILGFFTIVVASKANPMGIFIQKILWLIYSIYLFITTGAMALLNYYIQYPPSDPSKSIGFIIANFFIGKSAMALIKTDNTILIILFVVAIAVFIIMVVSEKPILAWIAKEKRDAEIEGQKGTIERSHAYDKARSDAMQNQ